MVYRQLLEGADDLLRTILGKPESLLEFILPAALAVVVLLVVLKSSGQAAGGTDAGWLRRMVAGLVLLVVVFLAAVAALVFVEPELDAAWSRYLALLGLPALAALLLAMPLMKLLLIRRYTDIVTMALMSLFAAAITIVVSTALLNSFRGGNKGFSQVKKRTSAIDAFIAK